MPTDKRELDFFTRSISESSIVMISSKGNLERTMTKAESNLEIEAIGRTVLLFLEYNTLLLSSDMTKATSELICAPLSTKPTTWAAVSVSAGPTSSSWAQADWVITVAAQKALQKRVFFRRFSIVLYKLGSG